MERTLSDILHVSYISRLYETGFTCTNDGSSVGNEMATRDYAATTANILYTSLLTM